MVKESEAKKEEEYRRLESVLSPFAAFITKHDSLNYIEFDYYTVHDLTLFTIEPNFDFQSLQATSSRIVSVLPAIKRIFAKPIIVLKDSDDVLPVETVHIINQATMLHLANHSEIVDDITSKGIKPRKLLTRIYEDDYGIYENLVFCNFIDETMKYVRQNIRSLRDLVYASSIMEFNLLERVNHMDYFLSIGKLHTGYIRDFEKYYGISKTLYNNLRQISNAILPRLHKPVYQKNKIRNRHLSLKKTNIFLMQKDYHQVYVLYKYLLSKKPIVEEEKEKTDLAALQQNYFYFVQTICIFAVGHFNFEIDPSQKMDMKNLDSTFTFKDWSVRLVNLLNKGLLLSIRKDKTYQIILTPSIQEKNEDSLNDYSIPYKPDEVHICTPFEEDYLERKEEFISIENIESFRRIQQLILKGMIYSDTERKECPFCLSQLTYNKKEKFYECESCRTQIKEGSCKENGKKYYYTDISNLKKTEWNSSDFSKEDQWLYQRRVEANLFFRNITKIDNKGRPICPHCGKIHDK